MPAAGYTLPVSLIHYYYKSSIPYHIIKKESDIICAAVWILE